MKDAASEKTADERERRRRREIMEEIMEENVVIPVLEFLLYRFVLVIEYVYRYVCLFIGLNFSFVHTIYLFFIFS